MYVNQSVSVLFYRKIKKMNKTTGKAPVHVRLTIDGIKEEKSTGIFVLPENWNQDSKRVERSDPQSEKYNKKLAKIENDLLHQGNRF